ncbi:related to 2-polyprenyl-6-methoxyphenol hydroxylase and related FAD-dependent oxidoreductases [Ustilago sp. UG-2017a]|nr:related to 2-polyprenyl-6-methoxyphenol hydroxylase and related FAD-dependent oxidoreductases [Ustilago sp. UG-2017a]
MRVLISGAGIAGPTLAHFLSRFGTQVTIVEKASTMLTQGHNIDVHGTALNIINKMGLLTELKKRNTTEMGTRFLDENGFPRRRHSDLLYQATRQDRNIDYRFGTTITEVVENSEEKVRVKLSNNKEEEYDLLVAADGQWSPIRKAVFPADAVQVINKGCYCVSRTVHTRPDNHGTLRFFITTMPPTPAQKQAWDSAARSHNRKTQMDLIRSELADIPYAPVSRLLEGMVEAKDLYFQTFSQIRLSKWSKNRVICLGDTAYAPTPFTGMGTSLAINGAYLLAGHLSQLKEGEHPRRAFEEYEKEFKPFVQEIQDIP